MAAASMLTLGGQPASAQSVQLTPFGGQGYDSPFHVTGAPADPTRVFVVEGPGTIRLVKGGVTQPTPFLDIGSDVWDAGEGGCECGLFSMAPAPDYPSSGRFYVFYTRDFNPGFHYLRIEEFRRSSANPDIADPTSRRIVLEIPHLDADNHNGGQLQFGPDGRLYVWVGDGGPSANAQNLGLLLGKLLRIDPGGATPFSYSIPADNPFADGPGGNRDEIYAAGLRNPWRGSFDRSTGDLTIADVGEGSWEEVDFKPEGGGLGANFGWNCFEGMEVAAGCPVPNHSPPVLQYANGGSGAAIAGGFVIRDSALPSLAGRYVYTDSFDALGGDLRTAVLAPGGATGDTALGLNLGGVVSFGQDACGHIYVAALSGAVQRLQPTGSAFPCKIAPVLVVKKRTARGAARRGAVVLRVLCDEDCVVSGSATVRIRGGKKLKARKASRKLELGSAAKLKLDLSKGKTRRLRSALSRGRRAVVRFEVSATGGGGGTDTARGRVKLER